jgi:hypothetical protein
LSGLQGSFIEEEAIFKVRLTQDCGNAPFLVREAFDSNDQLDMVAESHLQMLQSAIWLQIKEGVLELLLQDGVDGGLACILEQAQRFLQVRAGDRHFLQRTQHSI